MMQNWLATLALLSWPVVALRLYSTRPLQAPFNAYKCRLPLCCRRANARHAVERVTMDLTNPKAKSLPLVLLISCRIRGFISSLVAALLLPVRRSKFSKC